MRKTEIEKIRKRISDLEQNLKENEDIYRDSRDIFIKNRILMQSFNIESQLYALHWVLGEDYKYKHM